MSFPANSFLGQRNATGSLRRGQRRGQCRPAGVGDVGNVVLWRCQQGTVGDTLGEGTLWGRGHSGEGTQHNEHETLLL